MLRLVGWMCFTGIIDKTVNLPKRVQRSLDCFCWERFVDSVSHNANCLVSLDTQFLNGLIGFLIIYIGKHDFGSFGREKGCGCPPNPCGKSVRYGREVVNEINPADLARRP